MKEFSTSCLLHRGMVSNWHN